MESLSLAFSSGWASGVNAYLVVLVLGIADRVGDLAQIPDVLGRWEVLAVAAFMYAMEFVADKIPYVDSTWDVDLDRDPAHRRCGDRRPARRRRASTLDQAVSGTVGGGDGAGLAPGQGRAAGWRSTPRPSRSPTSWPASAEDVAVLGVVWFAIEHPRAAAAVAAVFLVVGLVLLYFVARLVRRGWRRCEGPRLSRSPPLR